jgi:ribosome assembly protein RRB1
MSKRSATELRSTEGQAFCKASGSGVKRENVTNDDMGQFEDAWEDEIESDEDIVDGAAEGEDGVYLYPYF